ncbi:two-component system sensor histidine kinase NtrB [Pontixanthobacter sp.]|uniref:two-component system sensor histidine kinase NtrB n=1 Tax=Pontixanthobacter sp. TaxID=2792078 RepID=UPI003C7CEB60
MSDISAPARFPTAQEQLSGMLFAVVLLGPDLCIAEVNHAAEDLLGRSAKRLIGKQIADVVNFADSGLTNKLTSLDGPLLARGLHLQLGGYERHVNFTASPVLGWNNWQVLTFSDAGRDDMRSESDPPSALKAPAILAHEIKNPLSAIRGAGQLIARKLDEKDRKLTAMIADEVDRIARLVDRMQELGSSSAGPLEKVNLHASIRSAMASVRAAAGGRAELSEEFDPSLPPIAGHRDTLEQALINLLTNAVDACDSSENGRIIVRTRFVSGLAANVGQAGKAVRLPVEVAICDHGPGLDPALGDHVFEPFVTTKTNGQGLGLALVKKLVSDMGGRVSHQRDTAKGQTQFRIHLALADWATD